MVNKADDTVVDYFSVLLKQPQKKQPRFADPETGPSRGRRQLQSLLSGIARDAEQEVKDVNTRPRAGAADAERETRGRSAESISAEKKPPAEAEKPTAGADNPDEEFQILYFSVAGLVLAVPLVSLGGIIRSAGVSKLPGRPDWFSGVQSGRGRKVNVVDTAAWVMPEKYTARLKQSISYQYVILLEGSDWGLACESLMSADTIDKSEVNWRRKTGARPWLAGVVRDKMCAILNTDALIQLLDKGLNCQDSIN